MEGQYFYRARFYEAGVGRFLSEDPLGLRKAQISMSMSRMIPWRT